MCRIDPRETRSPAVAADFLGESAQDAVEHDGFDFGQKPLRRHFFAIGVLYAGEAGEGS